MKWRVRTTLPDRPGILADLARACGTARVNIDSMQVFVDGPTVTDELVIDAPEGWNDLQIAALFADAGGDDVTVTRIGRSVDHDATTRYLLGVQQIIEEGRPVEEVLTELLHVEPPDVADYTGHDVLDLTRRDGSALRISRAVPFTPTERARAQALLSLVSDPSAHPPARLPAPSRPHPVPLVRPATSSDADAVERLHERCSVDTLYHRYQVPLQLPMSSRMSRRLVTPDDGLALLVQIGLDIVGHALVQRDDAIWTCRMLIEDAWQGRGLGTVLVKQAAGRARGVGAERLTFVTAGPNDHLLKAVGNAGFMARVERHDGNVHITVPLASVRAIATG